MYIDYTVTSIGTVESEHELFSTIEGSLIILIDGQIFLAEENILLLELAHSFKNWFENKSGDFIYKSMDYEEYPLLFFKKISVDFWSISSVWTDRIAGNIEFSELITACQTFVDKLKNELVENNVKLNKIVL